jgi:hypothetical protein
MLPINFGIEMSIPASQESLGTPDRLGVETLANATSTTAAHTNTCSRRRVTKELLNLITRPRNSKVVNVYFKCYLTVTPRLLNLVQSMEGGVVTQR